MHILASKKREEGEICLILALSDPQNPIDRDHLVWKNYGNYTGNIPERESKKREWIIKSGIENGNIPKWE